MPLAPKLGGLITGDDGLAGRFPKPLNLTDASLRSDITRPVHVAGRVASILREGLAIVENVWELFTLPELHSLMANKGRRLGTHDARKRSGPWSLLLEAGLVFVVALGAALYVLTPEAPGRAEVNTFVDSRRTDQHFSGCNDARAAGRENIPRWDPSYREQMDGDGDGLACEPFH